MKCVDGDVRLEDDGERDDQRGAEEEAVGEEGEDEEAGVDHHLGEQHLPRREQLDQHHADRRPPLQLKRRPHRSISILIETTTTWLISQQEEEFCDASCGGIDLSEVVRGSGKGDRCAKQWSEVVTNQGRDSRGIGRASCRPCDPFFAPRFTPNCYSKFSLFCREYVDSVYWADSSIGFFLSFFLIFLFSFRFFCLSCFAFLCSLFFFQFFLFRFPLF